MNAPLRVFVGFDPRQLAGFTACVASLYEHAISRPVSLTPLSIPALPIDRVGLTPFSYSRFLVPWLCDHSGYALYIDMDTLFRADVAELFEECWSCADPNETAVWVADLPKDHGFEQSAVMLFNAEHEDNKRLTPHIIEHPPQAAALAGEYSFARPHLIDWTNDVRTFSADWHHLVGYHAPNPDAKLVHFTQGLPFHPECQGSEFEAEFTRILKMSISSLPWRDVMGASVHTQILPSGESAAKLFNGDRLGEPMPAFKGGSSE